MSSPTVSPPKASNFQTQANCLENIISQCSMAEGDIAQSSYITISKDEVAELRAAARRLWLMAPHENQIKDLVLKYDN